MISLSLLSPDRVAIRPLKFLGEIDFARYQRCLAGARYVRDDRHHVATVPMAETILGRLRDAKFEVDVDSKIETALGALQSTLALESNAAESRLNIIAEKLKSRGLELYPYQRRGVKWLVERLTRGGALLADEMGLGKTVQTLIALPDGAPAVVVCPAVAKGVWRAEFARWRPEYTVTILSGRGAFRWPIAGEVVVINYDILSNPDMPALPGTVIIADEAHALKSFRAKRTQAFRAIAAGKPTILLTATPLLNKPQELWSILASAELEREAFRHWAEFVTLFRGYKGRWGGYEWGKPDAEEIAPRLARVTLRRLRTDVLPDLPGKTYKDVEIEVNSKLRKMLDTAEAEIERLGGIDAVIEGKVEFEGLSTLRKLLCDAKTSPGVELISEYEEQEEPLIAFSAHRAPIDLIGSRDGWAAITGDTSPEDRAKIVERFQAGQLRGVAATIQAAGVALTLTRAAHALFIDTLWTPGLNSQAEDRICRIGQTRGCVITRLVAAHRLDRRVTAVLRQKQRIISESVDSLTRAAE